MTTGAHRAALIPGSQRHHPRPPCHYPAAGIPPASATQLLARLTSLSNRARRPGFGPLSRPGSPAARAGPPAPPGGCFLAPASRQATHPARRQPRRGPVRARSARPGPSRRRAPPCTSARRTLPPAAPRPGSACGTTTTALNPPLPRISPTIVLALPPAPNQHPQADDRRRPRRQR